MNFRQKNRNKLDITLTPMIDVVFLLLIFFMVTTTFSRETQIKIKLPEAEGEERGQQPKIIALTIDAKGIYYVNDHQVINQKPATLKKAIIGSIFAEKTINKFLTENQQSYLLLFNQSTSQELEFTIKSDSLSEFFSKPIGILTSSAVA